MIDIEPIWETVEHTPVRLAARSVGTPEIPPVDDTWPKLGQYARDRGLYLIERTATWREMTVFLHPVSGKPQHQYEGPFLYPTERDTQKRLFVFDRSCLAVDLPPERWPDLKWWASHRWGTFYTAEPVSSPIAGYVR